MLAIRPDNPSSKHFDRFHKRSDALAPYAGFGFPDSQIRSQYPSPPTVGGLPHSATPARPDIWQAPEFSANRRPTVERLLNSSSDIKLPPLRPQTPLKDYSMSAVPPSESSESEPSKPVREQKDNRGNPATALGLESSPRSEPSSSLRLPPLQSLLNSFDSSARAPLSTVEPHANPAPSSSLPSTRPFLPIQALQQTGSYDETARVRATGSIPAFSRPQTAAASPVSSYAHTPRRQARIDLLPSPFPPPASGQSYSYARDRSISNASTNQSHGQTPLRQTLGKRKLSDVQEHVASPGSAVASASTSSPRRTTSGTSLRIRQQPRACRACGFGERDRRVIDPPPILSFEADDDDSQQYVTIAHASLLDEQEDRDVTHAQPSNRKLGGTLMGNLVASCIFGRDEHNRPGKFFVFTDLSCRAYGNYRLRFSMVRLPMGPAQPGTKAPAVDHVVSDVFTVYSAKASLTCD